MNNGFREQDPCCYFHPKEVVVGVCALCLNERLLILASKQRLKNSSSTTRRSFILHRSSHNNSNSIHNNPLPNNTTFSKIFAFSSFLNRLEFRHSKSQTSDHDDASTSPEDSFISIKFEENGVASWEKNRVSKVTLDNCSVSWNSTSTKEAKDAKSVIEHSKTRTSLRWRKRIGHLFQVVRRQRSSKANVSHVGSKPEGVKLRKGWIRTLTKFRTME